MGVEAPTIIRRLRILVRGLVQDVGFRPFVAVLARRHDLAGWVRSDDAGVAIEIEGTTTERFVSELRRFAPPLARVDDVAVEEVATEGERGFRIVEQAAA